MIKYIIVFFMAVLLSGCDLSKQEVDAKVQECLTLGGEPLYRFSKSRGQQAVDSVLCKVKTPAGEEYTVRTNGRGLM